MRALRADSGSGDSIQNWAGRQKEFYAKRPHAHLQYEPESVYAQNLVRHVLSGVSLERNTRILEVGCGAGRFSLHMIQEARADLVGLDFSKELLQKLKISLEGAEPSQRARCRVRQGDVYEAGSLFTAGHFDAVVGFFFLHHLENISRALKSLRKLLRPGGKMIFVEPNRRNPLFFLQVLCCPDMTWGQERGMFTLGKKKILRSFHQAGMSVPKVRTFGFFPPQVLDRFSWAWGLEKKIERIAPLYPFLPFRLIESVPRG